MKRYFTKWYMHMANKYMKICSALLAIRKMQIKQLNFTLHLLEQLKLKKKVPSSLGKDRNLSTHTLHARV